jgi:histidine triad (HIT) family protein
MTDCVFCKIIAGEIPAAMLIETDEVISFLDVAPVNPGHALVVPRRHAPSLLDLHQKELHIAVFVAQRVAGALREAAGCPAFHILQNDGEEAGQVVPHVHFHVIPRAAGDGFSLGWRRLPYAQGQMEEMQRRIRERL